MAIRIKNENFVRTIETTISLAALIFGGLVYIIFRSESLLMFQWFQEIGIMEYVERLRLEFGHYNIHEWVKDCMPAGLWLFSYLFIIDAVWWKEKTVTYKIFLGLLPVLASGSEIMQYYRLLPGTFDIMDICSYFVAILLFIVIKII